MFSSKTEYFTPKTIEEARSLVLKYKGEAKIIAGGTDPVVQMKHKEVLPMCPVAQAIKQAVEQVEMG